VDGPQRPPTAVDPEIRTRVGEMQREAFEHWRAGHEEAEETTLVDDVADRLSEIAVPTLVIVGELDVPDMYEVADRLERELPNVRRATIRGAAHLPSLERPQEFEELVLEFLAELEAA
jgi:pimeloyl-ACP methyl ester carboxylesterase